eukprot:m.236949 g.236949  ORF g.236949 m.236949 type:complete len:372 (-) comp13061_c0_seq1:43-1158(-)
MAGSFSTRAFHVLILLGNIVGQAMQNISLPLALSNGDDMSVVLIYTGFVYFCFFSILDVVLDVFCSRHVDFNVPYAEPQLVNVALQNALNGIGAIFGGSAERLPLTLQMSSSLLANLASPFYKLLVYGIPLRRFFALPMMWKWYTVAALLYFLTFILTLVDKVRNVDSGEISGFGLFFVAGAVFGMTYNVHQDKLMRNIDYHAMGYLESLKICTSILRKQLTWLFIFTWLSVLLSMIPKVNQSGTFSSAVFLQSWSDFITFQNVYMNLFNLGYIICFVTSVFLNKFDSSFNMLTSNVSAVLSLWTGWMPSIRLETVGFYPSLSYTIPAILCSCAAIVPSYIYSKQMKNLVREHESAAAKASETRPLINGDQ